MPSPWLMRELRQYAAEDYRKEVDVRAGGDCLAHQWVDGGTRGRRHCGVCHEPESTRVEHVPIGTNVAPAPAETPATTRPEAGTRRAR